MGHPEEGLQGKECGKEAATEEGAKQPEEGTVEAPAQVHCQTQNNMERPTGNWTYEVVLSVLAGLHKEYETLITILEANDMELDLDEAQAKLLHVKQRLIRQEEQETSPILQDYSRTLTATQDNRDEVVYYQLWTLDSDQQGTSTRTKPSSSQLRNLDEDFYITFGNQTKEPAHGIGDIAVRTRLHNAQCNHFILKDVFYVPGAMTTLFSVRQAISRGAKISLQRSTCTVSLPKTGTVIHAAQHEGLYCFAASATRKQP